ncbi:hypothetical protein ACFQU0_11510 [Hydrogenophaga defluvii]|uniref:Uncharacterized protein n=2 Tax=Hydrogenophaga defluvii TaxID=249410 RepID=A0ABW2SC57_9BURK
MTRFNTLVRVFLLFFSFACMLVGPTKASERRALEITAVSKASTDAVRQVSLVEGGFSNYLLDYPQQWSDPDLVPTFKYGAAWRVGPTIDIVATHSCSVRYSHLFEGVFWPRGTDCDRSLFATFNKVRYLDAIEEAMRSRGERMNREMWSNPYYLKVVAEDAGPWSDVAAKVLKFEKSNWKLDNASGVSAESLFDSALKGDALKLNFANGAQHIELAKFNELLSFALTENAKHAEERYVADKRKAQIALILYGSIFALGLLILYAIWRFVRRNYARANAMAREKAEVVASAATGAVNKLHQANELRKVRSAIMDETVREMTRQSLSSASPESKEVLVAELRKAIESGNHELANALELALKRA